MTPTKEQAVELRALRQQRHAMAYLDALEREYIERLVAESDEVRLRQLQGAIVCLGHLKQLILN